MKDLHEMISNLFSEIDELKAYLNFCLRPETATTDSPPKAVDEEPRSEIYGIVTDETERIILLCSQVQILRQRVDLPSQP